MVLPTAYWGPISYYQSLLKADTVVIEQWESFPKQTYRNRMLIAGANGPQLLSIPVGKCESKQYTKDVKISYQSKWQHQHWMALVSAYQHTPYFLYYEDLFRPFYEKQYTFLMDFNEEINALVMRLLNHKTTIERTQEWSKNDLEKYWQGHTPDYYQIFADKCGFQPNLSIMDLLCNMGVESQLMIK